MRFWLLVLASAVGVTLGCGSALSADRADNAPVAVAPKPPVIVPTDTADREMLRDLKNASPEVQRLVTRFDKTRDKYLGEQREMLSKLQGAVSPQERDRLRRELQVNRDAFLAELKTYRIELRRDLQDLKRKVNDPALNRLLDRGAPDRGANIATPSSGEPPRRGRN